MNEKTLNELFGSAAKTRLLKLFLLNQDENFELSQIAYRTGLRRAEARNWLKKLSALGFVKRVSRSSRGRWRLNTKFPLAGELQALIAKAAPQKFPELARGLKKIRGVKLVVITGAFLGLGTARADMLVVGDNINLKKFNELVRELEAEVGQEIRYVTLSRDEFLYRYRMFDRFLRDILESPHQKIINRLRLQ